MLAVAVLAAGKGTRMKSALPKVLQPLAGATLVERVLASAKNLQPERRLLIVGHQAERVEQTLAHLSGLEFVLQSPQNGTGHAVQQLLPVMDGFAGELLVLNGDVPLLRAATIDALVEGHRNSGADVTLLTARLADPTGYGRVFADSSGQVSGIIEHRDCSEEQRQNNLTNAGIYCFNWAALAAVLPKLSTDNDQGELYLTDTVAMLPRAMHLEVDDPDEVNGINNRKQLAQCEGVLQQRLRDYWMDEGVTFVDPASCTLSEDCSFGRDVVIEPQTHLRGCCSIGDNSKLGPGSLIENASLGARVDVVQAVEMVQGRGERRRDTIEPHRGLADGLLVGSGPLLQCRQALPPSQGAVDEEPVAADKTEPVAADTLPAKAKAAQVDAPQVLHTTPLLPATPTRPVFPWFPPFPRGRGVLGCTVDLARRSQG